MRVKARAVILDASGLVVVREQRRGQAHVSLPGGRVKDRESVTDALVREVLEETGLHVTVGRLLYLAEVADDYLTHDLNVIFEARIDPDAPPTATDLETVDLSRKPWPTVWPPILADIACDATAGWFENPRWLGNIRQQPDAAA